VRTPMFVVTHKKKGNCPNKKEQMSSTTVQMKLDAAGQAFEADPNAANTGGNPSNNAAPTINGSKSEPLRFPPTASTASTPSNAEAQSEISDGAFEWNESDAPGPQTRRLCQRLAETGRLYHTRAGDIIRLEIGEPPRTITDAVDLEGFIREHFSVSVLKNAKVVGNSIPASDLKILLRSPKLQSYLPLVDRVTDTVTFNSNWELIRPGYNHGPDGERIFYTGSAVKPKREPAKIRAFLAVMAFKSQADLANAVALALTVLLRFLWPGRKPFGAVTANKSHAGKDSVLDFATGRTKRVEISHHAKDWALQNEAVSAMADPNVGVLTIGNIRCTSGIIESAFIERIVTSPLALMQSSKRRGDGYERNGDFVTCATANLGRFSPDLANRSLPIHLEQVGDISNRVSAIGDPRNEFLPANRAEIEAELCGLIENWKDAGSPLDDSVKHTMREWARTLGGILKANGFEEFLGNWGLQRSVNDSEREALAIIAHSESLRDETSPLRVSDIVKAAVTEGVIGTLMDSQHRESERAMARQMGVLLTAHRDETLHLETDDGVRAWVIRKERRNDKNGHLATVYRFETVPPVTDPKP